MEYEYSGYKIVGDGTFGYKSVKAIGRGSVPKELRGVYTTDHFAKTAVDSYLQNTKGVNKDVKAESAG